MTYKQQTYEDIQEILLFSYLGESELEIIHNEELEDIIAYFRYRYSQQTVRSCGIKYNQVDACRAIITLNQNDVILFLDYLISEEFT